MKWNREINRVAKPWFCPKKFSFFFSLDARDVSRRQAVVGCITTGLRFKEYRSADKSFGELETRAHDCR
ncbi:hypothetical protein KFK09_004104 [Dendrobium nobile]|uniref:Uncharacterized protein n=1 Tax=Dendrobium nobile TaxID=94219 RepID=A0A8T3C514_DENNO|nr:hypothetical protein KFK09_004104 [Dendrobium nobile]